MAGFGRVAFEGEFFNQSIVNVFWFRSTQWLPNQGNPFDDVLAFLDAVVTKYMDDFLACLPADFTLMRAVGVGYDDAFTIVTSSPLVRDLNEAGYLSLSPTSGAAQAAIISLRTGEQVQINGVLKSKRNRGYICMGPVAEPYIDDYSHLSPAYMALLDTFAQDLDDGITVIAPAVTLTPIRVHQKYMSVLGHQILEWRTYSDVKGYTVQRVASYRRSRQPES